MIQSNPVNTIKEGPSRDSNLTFGQAKLFPWSWASLPVSLIPIGPAVGTQASNSYFFFGMTTRLPRDSKLTFGQAKLFLCSWASVPVNFVPISQIVWKQSSSEGFTSLPRLFRTFGQHTSPGIRTLHLVLRNSFPCHGQAFQ
jgi:hypothetical protein